MGFPAGLERTMIADLTGTLPAGTRRIRIVNNLKIYWDAIRIDQTPDVQDVRAAQVPLAKAALNFVGYPREMRLKPASDTTYSYSHRSMTGPYARAAGNYTRYGDVFDLLRASDDCFVVFGKAIIGGAQQIEHIAVARVISCGARVGTGHAPVRIRIGGVACRL